MAAYNKDILAELVADGQPHSTGELYDAYQEKSDWQVPRKDFLMFLREQVLRENGILKRASFGVYQLRTDSQDRGVTFERGEQTEPDVSPLESALEDLDALMDGLSEALQGMDQPELSEKARQELQAIRDSTLEYLDRAASGITAAMAWREDLEPGENPSPMLTM